MLAEGLSKTELTQWIRRVHEARDGSPRGVLNALGWETVVAKTVDPVLIAALDAMAGKVGLKLPTPIADTPAASETPRAPQAAAAKAVKPAASGAAPRTNAAVVVVSTESAENSSPALSDILTDDDLEDPVTVPPPAAAKGR